MTEKWFFYHVEKTDKYTLYIHYEWKCLCIAYLTIFFFPYYYSKLFIVLHAQEWDLSFVSNKLDSCLIIFISLISIEYKEMLECTSKALKPAYRWMRGEWNMNRMNKSPTYNKFDLVRVDYCNSDMVSCILLISNNLQRLGWSIYNKKKLEKILVNIACDTSRLCAPTDLSQYFA